MRSKSYLPLGVIGHTLASKC